MKKPTMFQFLITYGANFFAVVLLFSVLIYFNIFSPNNYRQEECLTTIDFICKEYLITLDSSHLTISVGLSSLRNETHSIDETTLHASSIFFGLRDFSSWCFFNTAELLWEEILYLNCKIPVEELSHVPPLGDKIEFGFSFASQSPGQLFERKYVRVLATVE